MPILKRGCIYTNIDPKKNGYINSIIPIDDRVVSEKLFICFNRKDNGDERPIRDTMCKGSV